MLGLLSCLLAGGLIGLCIGIYLVADRVCTTRAGCLACGRPWHHPQDHIETSPNVRVINPDTSCRLPQGEQHE